MSRSRGSDLRRIIAGLQLPAAPVHALVVQRPVLAIAIRGEIGRQVTAEAFERALKLADDPAIIEVSIDSPGGSVAVERRISALIRTERERGRHVRTVARGVCASSAIMIFGEGTERFASRSCKFLIHSCALSAMEAVKPIQGHRVTSHVLAGAAQMLREIDEENALRLAARTGLPIERFRREASTETAINARTAQALGLVHRITD
ncbi:hypothetical protein E8L99_09075 [Phreatobacter aquaticus]|uniref:ATP-dependent Clp protease proteolytic subunit n=1 Tax=Phreatobacter aquaticus TaxID=2570229 RepID=A0A4D7QGS7_9HYPH|nr:ATP-dependent Clp protease proteolytic subunit [Phreatobacter aquaticus]QCK85901.1 hypothetical protein E8L99_09075 [Phreatobacter aquaticus]